MPWLVEAMKDVPGCDKFGEPSRGFDPGISEWGNPTNRDISYRITERTRGIETS